MNDDPVLHQMTNFWTTGQYEKGLEFINAKSEPILISEYEDALPILIRILIETGKLDRAEDLLSTAISDISTKEHYTSLKARIHFARGKLEDGLALLDNAKTSGSLQIRGLLHRNLGRYTEAIRDLIEALNLTQKNTREHAEILLSFASIYSTLGKYQEASNYLSDSLEILRDLDNLPLISSCLRELGIVEIRRDRIDSALDYLEESVMIKRNQVSPLSQAHSIMYLLIAYVESSRPNKTTIIGSLLDELVRLGENKENKYIDLDIRVGSALKALTKNRLTDKAEAIAKFKQIVAEPVIDFQIHRYTILKLVGLLLEEFSLYQEPVVLDEINELLAGLSEFREISVNLQVELLILQSRIALISSLQLDETTDTAMGYLEEASTLVEQVDSQILTKKVEAAKQSIHEEINRIQNFLNASKSIVKKLERNRLQNYLNKVINLSIG